jgi:hypothetical protein
MHLLVKKRQRQGADYRLACAASQQKRRADVCFGSKADICGAATHVCFTSDSDHESGHVPIVMSALPPIATSIAFFWHVCFGPLADILAIRSPRWLEREARAGLLFQVPSQS